jgi:hypothetical protein
MFDTVDAARLEPGLMAIFEPRIEQFSFASAKETGGVFCAVTIRYQIFIYAPNGELVDTLSLTGYGSGPAPKIGNGEEELGIAAYAAMRDPGGVLGDDRFAVEGDWVPRFPVDRADDHFAVSAVRPGGKSDPFPVCRNDGVVNRSKLHDVGEVERLFLGLRNGRSNEQSDENEG